MNPLLGGARGGLELSKKTKAKKGRKIKDKRQKLENNPSGNACYYPAGDKNVLIGIKFFSFYFCLVTFIFCLNKL
jgi:hypothetical protein